jgi:anti-anti-sigma factor
MANEEIVAGFDMEKDDSLRISLKQADGTDDTLVLVLVGYIDTYNSNSFQKRVLRAIDSGFTKLVFDCTGLNYVSSTGIGSFTAFLKTLKSIKGDMVLAAVQPKVYEVFQLLGFAQFFNIKDDISSALGFLSGGDSDENFSAFPQEFSCPICAKRLKAVKSGRFRCSGCKTIIGIDDAGRVSLG